MGADWVDVSSASYDRRWVSEVVRAHRDAGVVTFRPADQQKFRAICQLDADVPLPDALAHAEKLLVVWRVSDRLSK